MPESAVTCNKGNPSQWSVVVLGSPLMPSYVSKLRQLLLTISEIYSVLFLVLSRQWKMCVFSLRVTLLSHSTHPWSNWQNGDQNMHFCSIFAEKERKQCYLWGFVCNVALHHHVLICPLVVPGWSLACLCSQRYSIMIKLWGKTLSQAGGQFNDLAWRTSPKLAICSSTMLGYIQPGFLANSSSQLCWCWRNVSQNNTEDCKPNVWFKSQHAVWFQQNLLKDIWGACCLLN